MSRACVMSVMYLSVCHGCSDSLIPWLVVVGFVTFSPMSSCTELAKRSARFRSKKETEHDTEVINVN